MKKYILLICSFCALVNLDAQVNVADFDGLKFRNIGPSRGGRSVASCGVPSDPMTYYMGSTGGGLWKTEDAGVSWKNISDGHFKMGSVGAIAIAPSDINVIYVGMGEHPVRGVMTSHGDGVYKSTDAGKTWKHIGLDLTRHIAEIRVHPSDPNIVFVAAQGAVHGSSTSRGIYKSEDGGNTWKKVLYVDANTGCADLSMDIHNPRILYAGMWDHRRYPWQVRSGGPGSGLYKSVDAGENWTKLEKGLPENMGKVAIDVSAANSDVVYANIEAEGTKAGVYRSNDAGKTWKQTTADRITIARAWYYIEIFADPKDEDKVYVLNAPMLKSINGGKNFITVKNPHGDQHHLWINPNNTDNIILSNDGGACITFNGGKTWSSQQNQMTIQFYRVITDERVPYYVYGGQQDNSTIATASRTNGSGIGWKDWYPVSGCESAFIAFDDPKNPKEVYGGCYQGNISVFNHETKESRDIIAHPTAVLGWHPADMKYRFNWNAPIVANHFDPSIIYHAGNKVLKTTDGGLSWSEISGDLTRNDATKHVDGGAPYTIEGAGGEVYNTIAYMACSPHNKGTIYTGSDCGKVYITQDEGQNWRDITPKGLPEALVNAIDISSHDPSKAYIAVTRYKFNDMSPMIYKTADYGKSWSKVTNGIPRDIFVRVVREDPKVAGLLYAGTENGLYISYDDGRQWENMQLNLPTCPITDLTFQDNDLIVATSGRSFWILDDLSAIQHAGKNRLMDIHLFTPKPTYDLPVNTYRTGGLGKNPKAGILIDYFLPSEIDTGHLSLEIMNEKGEVVRKYSNIKPKAKKYPGAPSAELTLPTKKGINRINWDLNKEQLPAIEDLFMLGGYTSAKASPGVYKAALKYNGKTSETTLHIIKDPRLNVAEADYTSRETFCDEIIDIYVEVDKSVKQFISVKDQLTQRQEVLKSNSSAASLIDRGEMLLEKMAMWEKNLIQRDQKTFQDVINFPNRLNAELVNLLSRVSNHDPRLTQGAKDRKAELINEWENYKSEMNIIVNEDIASYNDEYLTLNLPILILEKE